MDNTFDKMFYDFGKLIAGVDESGVSDIAGPLVAACVVLPKIDIHKDDLRIFDINDSKQIPEKYRKQHAEIIWQTAIGIGIGEVSASELDFLGREGANRIAMLRAVAACTRVLNKKRITPNFLLIDGTMPIDIHIPHKMIPAGDCKSLSIAAASIIAKVHRDSIMLKLHEVYPFYDWDNNKGYPSQHQFDGMDKHGLIPGVHRKTAWPINPRARYGKEDKSEWAKRRKLWKKITEKNELLKLFAQI